MLPPNTAFFAGTLECNGVVKIPMVRIDDDMKIPHSTHPYVCDTFDSTPFIARFTVLLDDIHVNEGESFILAPTIFNSAGGLTYRWKYMLNDWTVAISTEPVLKVSCTTANQNNSIIELTVTDRFGKYVKTYANLWVRHAAVRDVGSLLSDQIIETTDKVARFALSAGTSTAGKTTSSWNVRDVPYGATYRVDADNSLLITTDTLFSGLSNEGLGEQGIENPYDMRGTEVSFTQNYNLNFCGYSRYTSSKAYAYLWLNYDRLPLVINAQTYTKATFPNFLAERSAPGPFNVPYRKIYIPVSVSNAVGEIRYTVTGTSSRLSYTHLVNGQYVQGYSIEAEDMSGTFYDDYENGNNWIPRYKSIINELEVAPVTNIDGGRFNYLSYVKVDIYPGSRFQEELYLEAEDLITGETKTTILQFLPMVDYPWDHYINVVYGIWYPTNGWYSSLPDTNHCEKTGNPACLPDFPMDEFDDEQYDRTVDVENIYAEEGDYVRFIVIFDPEFKLKIPPSHYPSFIRKGHEPGTFDPYTHNIPEDIEYFYLYNDDGEYESGPYVRHGIGLHRWNEVTGTTEAAVDGSTGIDSTQVSSVKIAAAGRLVTEYEGSAGGSSNRHSLSFTFGPVFNQHNGLILQDAISWEDPNDLLYEQADIFQQELWQEAIDSFDYELYTCLSNGPVNVIPGKREIRADGPNFREYVSGKCTPYKLSAFVKARLYVKPRKPIRMVGPTVVYAQIGSKVTFNVGVEVEKRLPLDSYIFVWNYQDEFQYETEPFLSREPIVTTNPTSGGTIRSNRAVSWQDDWREFTCRLTARVHGRDDNCDEVYERKVILRVIYNTLVAYIRPVYVSTGAPYGFMTVTVSGGHPPYSYDWGIGETSDTLFITGDPDKLHNTSRTVVIRDFYGNAAYCTGMIYVH